MKQLLILSGKGGTGKTTVSASLAVLSNAKAIADCDVDAPNLHLVINESQKTNCQISSFFGGDKATVNVEKCVGCGLCEKHCKFEAVKIQNGKAYINEYACEGCGVCELVCKENAVQLQRDVAGEKRLYNAEKVFSTATLKMGRGNSGKLVADVKKAMQNSAKNCDFAIIDGSPGIGCPVIASASGVDIVLVVAEPSGSGISDLKRLVKTVKSFQIQLAICVNKFDVATDKTAEIEEFCKAEDLPFVGKIPFDKQAIKAVNEGKTLVDINCKSGEEIKSIYKKIMQLLA